MSSGSLGGSAGSLSAAEAGEGSRLRRTFTLPRNPFTGARVVKRDGTIESGAGQGGESVGETGGIERKLFRRGSWKRFISRIAHHMNTVAVPGVKTVVPSEAGAGCGGVPGAEPPWPAGSVPAATGIRNHGNTCYMNAVLQCLSHTDIIAEYFVLDHYKSDLLKRNKINSKKFGTRGEVTEQLAALLKSLWACQYSADMSTTFKSTVERHGTQYRGSSQHDAQEFLFWLLDKVHEDLNTATKKKYKTIKNTGGKPDEVVAAETLANHARRNSSFVQAVFQAQYRSALTCGRCERTSCTFDPFHCVSVQLPPRHSAAQPCPLPVTVVYVNQQPRQVRIGLELPPSATMEELRGALHADTTIPLNNIILAEISDSGWQATRGAWEGAGADVGQLYCVEAPALLAAPAAPYLLLLWINMLDGERFGSVYAMQVPRETSYADLQKLLLKEMAAVVPERVLLEAQGADIFRARVALAPPHLHDDDAYLQPDLPHPLFALGVEQALCSHDTHPHLRLELHWDVCHRNAIISECGDALEVHVSAGGGGEGAAPARAAPLTLHACLAHYTRAETLSQDDAWRCPQCQRYMPVVKTLGLWSLPDVLVIHLKRFRQQAKGRTSTKLTTMVEFPLTDFDMTPHLVRRASSSHESPGHSRSPKRRHSRAAAPPTAENVYDLYAVCYHHGDDLETGHYTAACKNPYDGRWYKFDDARVTQVEDDDAETELINNTAYMLFYRRKRPHVSHVRNNVESPAGHWALRMPKYVKKQRTPPPMNGITETKEEIVEGTAPEKEGASESEATAARSSPSLSRSASSLPEDSALSPTSALSTPSVRSPVRAVASIRVDNIVSTVEVNGNDEDRLSDYENVSEAPEPYIHKDVHVNPKMTPDIGREGVSQRPRSVDYPTRHGSVGRGDMNRNYESSPYVASVNGVEYGARSMFQHDAPYIINRHPSRISRDTHRTGEDTTAWKTRIST